MPETITEPEQSVFFQVGNETLDTSFPIWQQKEMHPLRAYRMSQQPPLSRAALADKLGVGRPTVFRWESGARKIDESLVKTIVEKTGIPAKELRPDLIERNEQLFGDNQ